MTDIVVAAKPDRSVMFVKNTSEPRKLAQSIVHSVANGETPVLRAIGAGAVNQAIKALAIARGLIGQTAHDLYVAPGWESTTDLQRAGTSGSESISVIILKVIIT